MIPKPTPATPPAFLITIDTEGDNLWALPREVRTENSRFLARFQALCERYGLKPAWLTDWQMAHCPVFREFASDVLRRGSGEIGMHLHAWSSPPEFSFTGRDHEYMPYLIEYPEPQVREKIRRMTECLRSTFRTPIVSHRAGRWALNPLYARVLVENGYRVDCSVTPHVCWRRNTGRPGGAGGSDYTRFPDVAYWLDLDDLALPGASPLLEVPMTIVPSVAPAPLQALARTVERAPGLGRLAQSTLLRRRWLRPNGRNRREMVGIIESALRARRDYVEFMLHSSEFMPGGSPTFPTAESIERLYADIEALFSAVQGRFVGLTLAEYHARFVEKHGQPSAPA